MKYFQSRANAGELLANELFEKYRYENTAIIALSDGGVAVAEPVATRLHCVLTMLVSESIEVPGEGQSIGAISQEGAFTYSSNLAEGQIREYNVEFHGYFEEKKREAFHRLNRLIGDGGVIDYDLLRDHTIILVSDGLNDMTVLDVALDFLKPVRIERLVVAAPVADVQLINKVHMMADELHILDVKDNYVSTDHYYEENDLPSQEETVAKINQIILNWR